MQRIRGRKTPRGLVSRSLIAVVLFALSVAPGWTLGDLAERRTGLVLADWLVTLGWTVLAVRVMAPSASYRPRDAVLGLVPIYGWFVACVLCWRVALLPYRDWEPRDDELWRARWLTGELLGYWRADPVPPVRREVARRKRLRASTGPAAAPRSR